MLFVNSHNLVNSKQTLARAFRGSSQEQKVFPCQVSAVETSSSDSGAVKKIATFFFFYCERSIFHCSFSWCSKNGEFMLKEKEQTCGKRLGLKNCSSKFEVKESDGQLKYVL